MLYNTSETKLIRDCEAEQKVQGFFFTKESYKNGTIGSTLKQIGAFGLVRVKFKLNLDFFLVKV